jgi:CubicO group peptidase (beta-lactamase class C family)
MRTIYTLAACIFLSCFATAQDFSRLDQWLKENTGEMGGRSMLVLADKSGKLIYAHADNQLNMRQKMALRFTARASGRDVDLGDYRLDSKQPIASCSKWLSAALIMTFIDDGSLKLTDTVGKFLPVLSRSGKGNITISQCLSHTTGIKAGSLKESISEMRSVASMDEAMEKIAALPMEGEPGKVFHYSNTGLQIAAAVIEKISGKDFRTLFAERITRPLHLNNTDFGNGRVPLPAGGAWSTPNDYLQFLVMILNKGMYAGKRILSEKAMNDMQVNRITPETRIAYSPAEAGETLGYGFGEWIMQNSNEGTTRTVTSPGLFGSFPWVDNQKGYCGFLMTYYIKPTGRGERYKELKAIVDQQIN